LVEADVVRGRIITSWPSLKTDVKNADAEWVDREVALADGLISSRKPDDLPAFNRKMIEDFSKGAMHDRPRRRARAAAHIERQRTTLATSSPGSA
jgi:protease I